MKKSKVFSVFIICFVTFYPVLALVEGQEVEVRIKFSIALLSPNTDEARNQWAVLIQKQLPKIGIDVYLHESTGRGNIDSRTVNYPLRDYDYIPTYAEGGFDILFLGRNWEKAGSLDIIYGGKNDLNIYNTFNIEKERYRGSYAGFDNLWTQCVYGSLFQRNLSNQSWEPYVAKNATIIPILSESGYDNNISIVVDINPDVKFSNGDTVLAEDVKYSYDLHLSPNAHSSSYANFVGKYLWSNDSIVEIDSDTVRFDFPCWFNFPFSVLSYGIIDKSIVEPIISTYARYETWLNLPEAV